MSTPQQQPPAYPFLSLFPSLQGERIVLASASPRRKQLLEQIGLAIEIVPSNFEENIQKEGITPFEYCTQTATNKALKTYEKTVDDQREPRLLIAADTIVLCGSTILEKPTGPVNQLAMLKRLRAEPHKVFTAVAVLAPNDEMPVAPGYIMKTLIEETTVTFDHTISDDILAAYIQCGEGSDKAGGYAIQGQGAILVDKINGSYDNVVGLPLNATYKLINSVLNHDVYADDNVNM